MFTMLGKFTHRAIEWRLNFGNKPNSLGDHMCDSPDLNGARANVSVSYIQGCSGVKRYSLPCPVATTLECLVVEHYFVQSHANRSLRSHFQLLIHLDKKGR